MPFWSPHTAASVGNIGRLAERKPDIHHGGNNRWGPLARGDWPNFFIPCFEPLEDDEEIHIPKQDDHEDELRNKLVPKIKFLFEVQSIKRFTTYANRHMNNSDYHS